MSSEAKTFEVSDNMTDTIYLEVVNENIQIICDLIFDSCCRFTKQNRVLRCNTMLCDRGLPTFRSKLLAPSPSILKMEVAGSSRNFVK